MGKFRKGILGPFSGIVGTVIGSTWKGISYMRSLPTPSEKAASEKQIEQRAKFGLLNSFLQYVKGVTDITFNDQHPEMSAFNSAVKYNSKDTIVGVYPTFAVDYSKIVLSKGSLTNGLSPVPAMNGGIFTYTWVDDSGSDKSGAKDQVILVAYCPLRLRCIYSISSSRSALTASLDVSAFKGLEVHTWVVFISEDRKLVSNSVYAGIFILPAA